MKIILLFISLHILTASCAKPSDDSPVVARVGSSVLTLEDLKQSIPPEYSSIVSAKQYGDYVKRWMEAEILFQEAKKRKLSSHPDISKQLNRASRDILIAEMVNRYCPPENDVSESRIQQYYEEYFDEFKRSQWELKILHILIPDKRKAWVVKNRITSGNFLQMARHHSIDPVDNPADVEYVSLDDMLPQLAEVAFKTRTGGTTNPIKTSRGWYILRIISKKPPGSRRSLTEVREEIISRLSSANQKIRIRQFVAKLKSEIGVETFLDNLPGHADSLIAQGEGALDQVQGERPDD